MIEIPDEFRTCLEVLKKDYEDLAFLVSAQMCLESNYGRSSVATDHHNYCGLGWRDLSNYLPADVLARVHEVTYTGQDQDTKSYLHVDDPADFPRVYFAFLKRSIYKIQFGGKGFTEQNFFPWKWEKYPLMFMAHVASKGFCGWTPSIKRKDYNSDEEYYRDTHADYLRSILKCSLSENFCQLFDSIGA